MFSHWKGFTYMIVQPTQFCVKERMIASSCLRVLNIFRSLVKICFQAGIVKLHS